MAATNNFLPINKLGQGGFGEVYKVLPLNRASLYEDVHFTVAEQTSTSY